MEAMLSAANPGFRSRFKQRVAFPDWDEKDVVEYLRRRCAKKGLTLTEGAAGVLRARLTTVRVRPGWANARDAEFTFDELQGARAQRLAAAAEAEDNPSFTRADAVAAMESFDRLRPPPQGQRSLGTMAAQLEDEEEEPRFLEIEPPREVEKEVEQEQELRVEPGDSGPKGMGVAAALQEACVELGYDEDNTKRSRLCTVNPPTPAATQASHGPAA